MQDSAELSAIESKWANTEPKQSQDNDQSQVNIHLQHFKSKTNQKNCQLNKNL